jgi:hypothetical protein
MAFDAHRPQPALPTQPSSYILSLAWLHADEVTTNPCRMDPLDAPSALLSTPRLWPLDLLHRTHDPGPCLATLVHDPL